MIPALPAGCVAGEQLRISLDLQADVKALVKAQPELLLLECVKIDNLGTGWKVLSSEPTYPAAGYPELVEYHIKNDTPAGTYILRLKIGHSDAASDSTHYTITAPQGGKKRAGSGNADPTLVKKPKGLHYNSKRTVIPHGSDNVARKQWSSHDSGVASMNNSNHSSNSGSSQNTALELSRDVDSKHSMDERSFLIRRVKKEAIHTMNANKAPPTAMDIVRRLIDRIWKGKFAVTNDDAQIGFQANNCTLVKCDINSRSLIRLDIVNYVNKCMPHALAFKLWRDPTFELKDWKKLQRTSRCLFGHGGGSKDCTTDHTGTGANRGNAWGHNQFVCINPFHYENQDSDGIAPMPKGPIFDATLEPNVYDTRSSSSSSDSDMSSGEMAGVPMAEFQWLLHSHRPAGLMGIDNARSRPDAADIITRILDKIKYGKLTKAKGKKIAFETHKCVLVNCHRESRSSVRMDIVNLASKCWPHALTYRLWRDPYFQMKEWQTLRAKQPLCVYGYAGPKSGGSGGWIDDHYICINPFHYEIVGGKKKNKSAAGAAVATTVMQRMVEQSGDDEFVKVIKGPIEYLREKQSVEITTYYREDMIVLDELTLSGVYLLLEGEVELTSSLTSGSVNLNSCSAFGQLNVNGDPSRMVAYQATAKSDCKICCLTMKGCRQLFMHSSAAYETIVNKANSSLQRVQELEEQKPATATPASFAPATGVGSGAAKPPAQRAKPTAVCAPHPNTLARTMPSPKCAPAYANATGATVATAAKPPIAASSPVQRTPKPVQAVPIANPVQVLAKHTTLDPQPSSQQAAAERTNAAAILLAMPGGPAAN